MVGIGNGQRRQITEDSGSCLKTNAMFREIGSSLLHVPFEGQWHRRILFRDADVLGLGEETERFLAAFAADAALFHAAEGNAEIADEPAVYPNGAGVNFFSDAMGAIEVLGPDTGGEAVIAVVRVADHFVFAVERRDGHDGPEDFFAVGATG